jgi:hypothetical protein
MSSKSVLCAAILAWSCETPAALRAPVSFTFTVPPTNGQFVPVYKVDETRKAFPPEDILITEISFKGVTTRDGSEVVPFHDVLKIEHAELLDLEFHHSLMHQGSADETYANWAHFTEKDVTSWSHGAIMYGTSLKKTSFKPFGTRLHKDVADIYTCIHAKNNRAITIDFVADWEIEYEILSSPEPDPRSMIVGWFSLPFFEPNEDAGVDETSLHVLVETDLVMKKDAKLLGWAMHHHNWLYEVDLKVNNHTFFAVGLDKDLDPVPSSDGIINWLKSENYNHELDKEITDEHNNTVTIIGEHDVDEFGYEVFAGEALQMDVIAGNPSKQTKGPLGVSLYFRLNDGTESLVHGSDLFAPPHDHIGETNLELKEKVDRWNRYIYISMDKKNKELLLRGSSSQHQ